jgi:acyl-CoA hydrolase
MNKHVIEAQTLNGRPVRESRSEHTYAALPNDANLIGNVLGGRIMHLVDLCGALAAERHSRRLAATAAVDHLSFLHPVHTGQFLILKSSVNRAFNTSMEVGVKVWSEQPRSRETRHILSAYLISGADVRELVPLRQHVSNAEALAAEAKLNRSAGRC